MALHRYSGKPDGVGCVACGEDSEHGNHRTPLACPDCKRTDQLHISYTVRQENQFFVYVGDDGKPARWNWSQDDDAEWEPMEVYCLCGSSWSWEIQSADLIEMPYVDPEEKAAIEGLRRVLTEVSQ